MTFTSPAKKLLLAGIATAFGLGACSQVHAPSTAVSTPNV